MSGSLTLARRCAALRTLVFLPVLLLGCDAGSPSHDLAGIWRVVLDSPGGALPFTIEVGEPGADPPAHVVNGPERIGMSGLIVDGAAVRFELEWYDSRLEGTLDAAGETIAGRWSKTIPGGTSSLPMTATKGDARRFESVARGGAPIDVDGIWDVTFTDDGGSEPARAVFRADGATLTGTFQTPLGDYRYLAGDVGPDGLRLSCFDGGHAFLFHARPTDDGALAGDFWSRDSYHATWTARRVDPEAGGGDVPDAWGLVTLTNPDGRFRFSFEDLDGATVAHDDARFDGKVVLVNLFGSWCPNCHDEAPHLAGWAREYADRGLEVVGLGFEFSGDGDRDREMLRRFAKRHGIGYPLLLAGTSDKKDAAARVPDIDRIVAYPTTIFVGRDGLVRKIYSGWSGPATGDDHRALLAELEGEIDRLLDE